MRAIAESRRREILALVHGHELSAGAIARRFDITWPAISQHLGVLKDAGLLVERREGRRRLYRVRPEGLAEVIAFLEAFWDDRLDALKAVTEADAQREAPTRLPGRDVTPPLESKERDGRDS